MNLEYLTSERAARAAAICGRLASVEYLDLARWVKDVYGATWKPTTATATVTAATHELVGKGRPPAQPSHLFHLLCSAYGDGLLCSGETNPVEPVLNARRTHLGLVFPLNLFGPTPLTSGWIRERAKVVAQAGNWPPNGLSALRSFSSVIKLRILRAALLIPDGASITTSAIIAQDPWLKPPSDLMDALRSLVKSAVVIGQGRVGRLRLYEVSQAKLDGALDAACFAITYLGLLNKPKVPQEQ
jgi:hypothetical protein